MSSLKDRIEAKTRRKTILPLQVGDTAAAAQEVATLRGALDVHLQVIRQRVEAGGEETEADRTRADELRAQIRAAKERQEETVALIELQALEAGEWDRLLDGLPEAEDGGYDVSEIRTELLAACCIDPDLQDEQWWAEQLKRPEYSKGDLVSINYILVALNTNVPDGSQGKG